MLTPAPFPFELFGAPGRKGAPDRILVPAAELQAKPESSYTVVLEHSPASRSAIDDVQASDRPGVQPPSDESPDSCTDSGDARQAQTTKAKQATPAAQRVHYRSLEAQLPSIPFRLSAPPNPGRLPATPGSLVHRPQARPTLP